MARIVSDMRTCSLLLSGGKLEFVYDILGEEYLTRDDGEFYALLKQMIVAYAVFHPGIFSDVVSELNNDMETSGVISKELQSIVKQKDLKDLNLDTTTISKGPLELKIQDGIIKSLIKRDEYGNEWNVERENKFFLSKLCSELTSLKKTSPQILEYICMSASKDGILQVMLESLNNQQRALA